VHEHRQVVPVWRAHSRGSDGCTTAVFATLHTDETTGIALWGANVFWVDNSGSSTNEGSVMRAPAAGGSPTTLAGSITAPWAITTNGVNIFWTQDISPLGPDDAIWELGNDAGPDAGPTAIASGLTGPGGIATDGVSLYWTNTGGYQPPGTVTSMSIAGGPVQTIASGQSYPTYIATDGVNVYWTDSLESGGTVMKWSIADGGAPVVLADNQVNPYGIATDGVWVYWTDLGDWIDTSDPVGMVMKVPVGGGTPTTLAASQARPALIAVDATSVYWTNEGTTSLGSVMKLTPK
jgi:hypothetical protein